MESQRPSGSSRPPSPNAVGHVGQLFHEYRTLGFQKLVERTAPHITGSLALVPGPVDIVIAAVALDGAVVQIAGSGGQRPEAAQGEAPEI